MRRARRASVGCSRVVRPGVIASGYVRTRMCRDRSPNRRGSKTRSVNRHAPSTASKRSRYSPAEDRVQTLPGDLQHGEVAAGASRSSPSTCDRHVRDLVHRPRRAVVVDDHLVVERARLGRAAQHAGRGGSTELGVLEQRGDAVEVAGVEPERVLVDQRGDRVDVARVIGSQRIGIARVAAHVAGVHALAARLSSIS